jgi:uncharacterized Zn-finger protein
MAHVGIPHFHNQSGVRVVHVGAREFMCIGALPPFDHPHIYIDMGKADEAICPYCSTLYRFKPQLVQGQCEPPECLYEGTPTPHIKRRDDFR